MIFRSSAAEVFLGRPVCLTLVTVPLSLYLFKNKFIIPRDLLPKKPLLKSNQVYDTQQSSWCTENLDFVYEQKKVVVGSETHEAAAGAMHSERIHAMGVSV